VAIECEVDGVEHQFDTHEYDNGVSPCNNTDISYDKKDGSKPVIETLRYFR
jgi:hypothetical protein